MKSKWLVSVVGVSMVLSSAFAETPKQEAPKQESAKQGTDIDLVGAVSYYKPGQDEDYDNGFGAEAQARFWLSPVVGLSLALGGASWQVVDEEVVLSDGYVAAGGSLGGDVTLMPLGGSLLLRPVNVDKIALTLELGLRYVMVDSQAEMELAVADSYGNLAYAKDTIDIDDGVIGLIGANVEGKVSDKVSLIGGIGYQFDVVKGDAKWMDEDMGENELKAFVVKLGVGVKL